MEGGRFGEGIHCRSGRGEHIADCCSHLWNRVARVRQCGCPLTTTAALRHVLSTTRSHQCSNCFLICLPLLFLFHLSQSGPQRIILSLETILLHLGLGVEHLHLGTFLLQALHQMRVIPFLLFHLLAQLLRAPRPRSRWIPLPFAVHPPPPSSGSPTHAARAASRGRSVRAPSHGSSGRDD